MVGDPDALPAMTTRGTPHHRIPTSLLNLALVDLLELTGSTVAAAELLALSQPSVSRRYRTLARELGLERRPGNPLGRRYADASWMAHLRRGMNEQRLSGGVLRIGGSPGQAAALASCPWADWVPLADATLLHWPQLLRLELLDGVALAEAPPQAGLAADLTVVTLPGPSGHPLPLACRPDPRVLAIAAGVG